MSASLELQKAIVARLKANSGVTAIVSQRIFDRVPEDAAFPFVQIGYFQEVDDHNECHDAFEVFMEIQCWSRAVGQVEAKQLAEAVRKALHRYSPTLGDDFAIVDRVEFEGSRSIGDGDGLTTRIIVTFKALIEAT